MRDIHWEVYPPVGRSDGTIEREIGQCWHNARLRLWAIGYVMQSTDRKRSPHGPEGRR